MDDGAFAGRRVVVWGLGRHGGGLAAARHLTARGAQVSFLDGSDPAVLGDAIRAASAGGWRVHRGDAAHPVLHAADLIVCSPAIPPRALPADPDLLARVTSPEALFFADHDGPRIAVTGTKGKSTTARILGELLGWPVAGNSHEPLLDLLAREGSRTPVVCELSSFQLWYLREVRPRFAGIILTRLDVDHLDWHGELAHYHASKVAVLGWSDCCVVAPDLARRLERAPSPGARWDADGFIAPDGIRLCGLDHLCLLGDHNRDNACLAITLAWQQGVGADAIVAGLGRVTPLPHRLRTVHRTAGLTFVDDSIATTPEAAMAGLRAVTGPLAVILGGSDKGADFAALAAVVRVRGAVPCLIGRCAPAIGRALAAVGVVAEDCRDLEPALLRAAGRLGSAGGTILLSPACASFDQFSGYEERGDRFLAVARHHFPGEPACA